MAGVGAALSPSAFSRHGLDSQLRSRSRVEQLSLCTVIPLSPASWTRSLRATRAWQAVTLAPMVVGKSQ